MNDKILDTLIIGAGPAGYTAAIYAARANLKPIIISGMQPGGQLTTTTEVENYPGFPQGIQGPALMQLMKEQVERFDVEIKIDTVTQVIAQDKNFIVKTNSSEFLTKTVIIATGASARWFGLESENKYKNRGISACATCDGFFFKDKEVAVLGGGDSAFEEAMFLTNFCKKVTLIHRRNEFRASQIMVDRARANEKIDFLLNVSVKEFVGDETKLSGIKVENNETGEISQHDFSGAFVAIGRIPNTQIFDGMLDMDENKYIITKADSTATNIPGIFASGDCQDPIYRQGVVAAGSGSMAAIEVERYLNH